MILTCSVQQNTPAGSHHPSSSLLIAYILCAFKIGTVIQPTLQIRQWSLEAKVAWLQPLRTIHNHTKDLLVYTNSLKKRKYDEKSRYGCLAKDTKYGRKGSGFGRLLSFLVRWADTCFRLPTIPSKHPRSMERKSMSFAQTLQLNSVVRHRAGG